MNTLNLNIWVIIHFFSLASLSIYGIHRLWMIWCWRKECGKKKETAHDSFSIFPEITVQLPLYNERFVAKRLIDAVSSFDWPKDKLIIQVLDDSTDETSEIVADSVKYWKNKSVRIEHLKRSDRKGFKAGALAEGMKRTESPFIAVFDADFIPSPDFLKKTMLYFENERIGMVQTRWDFVNSDYSFLTKIQKILLSPHFEIEHQVRFRRSLFFNFNGTAGIWRKSAIEDAGGWQADTVTEDLDLSYRAQIKGWKFEYVNEITVPSELPVTLSAFRSQQQRWAKGSVQTARKILPILIKSGLPLSVKIESFMHLLANFGWLFGALVTLTLYPTLAARISVGPYQIIWLDIPLFVFSGCAILFYYLYYALKTGKMSLIYILPLLPALSIGLAPSITLSVLQGLFRNGGEFKRTPKFGIVRKGREGGSFIYGQPVMSYMLLDSAFLIYASLPLFFAITRGTWPAIPFLALFPAGFAVVLVLDFYSLGLRND